MLPVRVRRPVVAQGHVGDARQVVAGGDRDRDGQLVRRSAPACENHRDGRRRLVRSHLDGQTVVTLDVRRAVQVEVIRSAVQGRPGQRLGRRWTDRFLEQADVGQHGGRRRIEQVQVEIGSGSSGQARHDDVPRGDRQPVDDIVDRSAKAAGRDDSGERYARDVRARVRRRQRHRD